MDYKVVTGEYLDEFESKVAAHLKEGWIPLGGVVIDHAIPAVYHQAMMLRALDYRKPIPEKQTEEVVPEPN